MRIQEFFPDKEIPEIKPVFLELYESGLVLGRKILEMFGHGMQLEVRCRFYKLELLYRLDITLSWYRTLSSLLKLTRRQDVLAITHISGLCIIHPYPQMLCLSQVSSDVASILIMVPLHSSSKIQLVDFR